MTAPPPDDAEVLYAEAEKAADWPVTIPWASKMLRDLLARCRAVEAERAKWESAAREVRKHVDAYIQENATLRGDKARLDWLFAHCQVDWFPDGTAAGKPVRMLRNREAVDAAAGESVELPVWAATQTKGGVPRSAMRARP